MAEAQGIGTGLTLAKLAARVVRAESFEESMRAVCEEVAAAFSVPLTTIYFFDDLTGIGKQAYIHGWPLDRPPSQISRPQIEQVFEQFGLLGQIPDVRRHPELPAIEGMMAVGTRSICFTAIRSDGVPMGHLSIVTLGEDERALSAEELQLLAACGELVESILERERRAVNQARILELMSEGVTLVDENRRILYANPAFERMLEYAPGELTGQHGSVVWFPEDLASSSVAWDEVRRLDSVPRRLLRFRTKTGREVWVSVAVATIRYAERFGGAVSVFSDVTQARNLEAKIQQAQKLESLAVLAGGVAHDFNNLLVGILGNAGLALEEMPPEAPAREQIADIHASAIRAAELTKQLLAYAGKGRFVIGRIDVNRLIEEMTHLVSAVVPKNVLVRYNLTPELPAIEGDATQLRQLVMNLATNAADAIGKGSGVLTVTTSVVDADRAYLADTYLDEGLPAGSYVSIELADTGVGMSAETCARIFDPFFTTKFTGRGLGLPAVLGILRAHRGAIKVQSEPGRGSTFRVLLPAGSGAAESLRPAPSTERRREAGLVLVVDDDEAVRNVAKRALERAGYRVVTAADGQEGVEVFAQRKDEIRAVLLDLTMPRMGGEEAFRRLRQLSPDVRVLLSSGYSAQEATSVFAGKGLAGFVEKPFTSALLLEKLRAVLDP